MKKDKQGRKVQFEEEKSTRKVKVGVDRVLKRADYVKETAIK